MATDEVMQMARLQRLLDDGVARHVREGAGLSKRRASARVGVSRQTLAAWESGTRPTREREAALRYLALLDQLMAGGRD